MKKKKVMMDQHVSVRMDKELNEWLSGEAEHNRCSRSDVLRGLAVKARDLAKKGGTLL